MRDGRADTRPNIAFERTACLTAFPSKLLSFSPLWLVDVLRLRPSSFPPSFLYSVTKTIHRSCGRDGG